MYPTAAFGFRHALDAMHTAFKFQLGENPLAANGSNNLLIAAHLALGLANHFHFPAFNIGMARIHAEQISGKQRRLVAARASAHFKNHIQLIGAVFGQQQDFQRLLHLRQFALQFGNFRLGHVGHFGIITGDKLAQIGHFIQRLTISAYRADQWVKLRIFLGQGNKAFGIDIAIHFRLHGFGARQNGVKFFGRQHG